MRHRKARTKMGRTSSHKQAMCSNMLAALVEHGRIQTTERKAKELRSIAEKAVARLTRLGDLLLKSPDSLEPENRARVVHALRMVRRTLKSHEAVLRLYNEWAPRYLGRSGGYTRTLKIGPRRGDCAPMVMIEFVPAQMPEKEGAKESQDEKKKGLLGHEKKA